MPVFWTGILLLMVFGGFLGWLPLSGVLDAGMSVRHITGMPVMDALLSGNWVARLRSRVEHLILPAITLGGGVHGHHRPDGALQHAGCPAISDYVRTARAKGVSRAAGRPAPRPSAQRAPPVVTVIGLQLGLLLSGAVLTETIFWIPGLGADSSSARSSTATTPSSRRRLMLAAFDLRGGEPRCRSQLRMARPADSVQMNEVERPTTERRPPARGVARLLRRATSSWERRHHRPAFLLG